MLENWYTISNLLTVILLVGVASALDKCSQRVSGPISTTIYLLLLGFSINFLGWRMIPALLMRIPIEILWGTQSSE